MTSEVGTDLRAVRPLVALAAGYWSRGTGRREFLPGRVALLCHVRRSGAFGEIALPRKCSGEAEFVAGTLDVAR